MYIKNSGVAQAPLSILDTMNTIFTKPPQKLLRLVGACGVTTNGNGTANQPRIHRDRGAVIGETCLVVLIYKMVCQLVDILISEFFAIHLLDAVSQQTAVQTDEVRFR